MADATKVKVYMKNFGEFYNNQIEAAGTDHSFPHAEADSQEKLEAAAAMLREKNPDAAILTTPWDELDGKAILSAIEKVSLSGRAAGEDAGTSMKPTSMSIITIITTGRSATIPTAPATITMTMMTITMSMSIITTTTMTSMTA